MATTTNTLRLKVGGKYMTRDGRAVEIDAHDSDPAERYPFSGSIDGRVFTWRPDGRFLAVQPNAIDLVSEIQDEAPAYRYFCYKNRDSNFSGQDMRWRVVPGGRPEACDSREGVWRVSAHSDVASLEESTSLVECDADGNLLAPAALTYRYFRYRDESPTDGFYVIWRVAPGSDIVEGICPNLRDEGTETSVDLQRDLVDGEDIVECDADGNPLGVEAVPYCDPDDAAVSFKTTEDLTPEQRTRIAKLAARIVLADGPVLTVDELAGMTIGELVCKLEGITDIYSI